MLLQCQACIDRCDPDHSQKYRKCYRPGGGAWNNSMISTLRRLGYENLILGNVFGHDAWPYPGKWFYRWTLKHRTRPGSIIIVHDRRWQADVLRGSLPYIRDKLNIKLCTLDHLWNVNDSAKGRLLSSPQE